MSAAAAEAAVPEEPILVAEEVRKEFGGLVAVNDVDFTIPTRSIVSLIGPNGAGKTTFFNMLTGVYTPTSGKVIFDGKEVTDKPPHAITELGVGRTFQNIRLFEQMTALENVLVGMHARLKGGILGSIFGVPRVRREERQATERARELLRFSGTRAGDPAEAPAPGRADGRDEPAGDGRVHRLRRPAASGRGAHRADDRARHEGRDEHRRPRDRARLRREDRRGLARGGPAGRARDRGVSRQDGERVSEGAKKNGGGVILRLDDIHTFYGAIHALKGISIEVREGEIVTLIGANGAGKSTTLRSINGLNHPRRGRIEFAGRDITSEAPHRIVKMGISQSPEGRKLFSRMSVRENLEMGAFQRSDRASFKEDLDRVYSLFPRLAEREHQKAGTMSGGEQQMCAMGRALMAKPKLLLLDEPSMGLAPIFVERIFEIVREINEQGTPILLVEQNALMALDAADRAYVLETGRIALADDAKNLRENEQVQKAYLGID